GRNALFDGEIVDCIHQNHIIRVRLAPDAASPHFVSEFLNSPSGQLQMIEKARTSSGLFTLSVGKVSSLELPLPPIETQLRVVEEISTKLRTVEVMSRALEQQLNSIEAMPTAFLQQAFSGELV